MEKIRICNICEATSQTAEFYKGVTSRCRECHKEQVRSNRAANLEYYRSYDAKRFQNDPRVKERHKRYAATEAGKQSLNKSRKKWIRENSDKRAAHIILGNAVRDGKIEKPSECEKCGASPNRIEGHHENYTKPLDVIWLCRKCHYHIHQ